MEKEKLNKLNVKLEKDLDQDIIEILDKVQNKTLFTKTAIRLAYQQMLEDPSIARVREPGIFKWDKFIEDVESNKNNSTSIPGSSISRTTVGNNSSDDDASSALDEETEELDDEELF